MLTLAIFFVIVFGAGLRLMMVTASDALVEHEIAEAEENLRSDEMRIELFLFELKSEIRFISRLPGVVALINYDESTGTVPGFEVDRETIIERINEAFSGFMAVHPQYAQLRYIDENGFEVVRINSKNGVVERVAKENLQNKKERYYFQEAMTHEYDNIYISPVDLNKEGSPPQIVQPIRPMIRLAAPIFDKDGNRKGAVISNVNAEALFDIFGDAFFGTRVESLLVDQDGYYLFHPEEEKRWGGSSDLNTGEQFRADYEGFQDVDFGKELTVTEANGNISYSIPIRYDQDDPDRYWVLFRFVPKDLFREAFLILRQIVVVFALVMIGVTIMFVFWFARFFTRPIDRLSGTVRDIKRGKLSKRARIDSNDEIGEFAKAFNDMADKLTSSLREIENIYETVPESIIVMDKTGAVISANQATYDLLDISKKQLAEKHLCRYLTKRYKGDKHHECVLMEKFQSKGRKTLSLDITRKGTKIPVQCTGAKLQDENGELVGFLAVINDLSVLKKYAKTRVDTITPVLHSLSLGDFTKRLELPDEEDEFTDLLVATDLMADNLQALIAENKQKADDLKASAAELQKSNRNITKSKALVDQEKIKLEAILNNMGEGIVAIDAKGDIIFTNPSGQEILKWFNIKESQMEKHVESEQGRVEDLKGNPVPPKNWPINRALKEKKKVRKPIAYISKDVKVYIDVTATPIMHGKTCLGAIAIFHDITKEREIDQAKSEFVSLASHQLRTPSTGIKWLLEEVLRRGKLKKDDKEYIEDALKSNHRMIQLVNDLLNVSRLETGAIDVTSEPTDLPALIKEIVQEANILAKDRGQTLTVKVPKKKINISLDQQLIGQVIANLVSNAIKYSNPNTKVTVELLSKPKGVEMRFMDQGIGISKDDQKKLFTKFYRTAEAAKYSTTGSGLGLYIIKKILHVCHGNISVESEEGKGSTFVVTLPLKGPVKKSGNKKIIQHKIS